MPLVKTALRYFAAYAIAFILVFLTPEHIHRRDFDRAFFTWWRNRTPQNEAALRVEQNKNEIIHLQDSAGIALVVVIIGFGTYNIARFVKRGVSGHQNLSRR
jgi:hypothetical protein